MDPKSYLLGCPQKMMRDQVNNKVVSDKEKTQFSILTIVFKILTIVSQSRLKIVLAE